MYKIEEILRDFINFKEFLGVLRNFVVFKEFKERKGFNLKIEKKRIFKLEIIPPHFFHFCLLLEYLILFEKP